MNNRLISRPKGGGFTASKDKINDIIMIKIDSLEKVKMIETIVSIGLGVGLAASAGFRVFVPLFIASVAVYFGIIPVNENFTWVASTPALVTLGVASVVESIAYLVPLVDNLLDTIAVPLAGVAGTLVMAATMSDMSPEMTWALAIIAGGGAAATISGTTAAGRTVSSGTTAGMANPVISVGETGTAIGLSTMAVFAPALAFAASVLLIMLLVWLVIKIKKRVA